METPIQPPAGKFCVVWYEGFFLKDSTVSYLRYTLLETKSKLQIKIAFL